VYSELKLELERMTRAEVEKRNRKGERKGGTWNPLELKGFHQWEVGVHGEEKGREVVHTGKKTSV